MKHDFERFCKDCEKIENFEKAAADNFKGWNCHHRLETHFSSGEKRLVDITRAELKALDMYYNRPAEELIFLRRGEHTTLHHKGKSKSEEHKKKISLANKGKQFTEEHKKKLSEARKGKQFTEEHKKKMSEARKGKPKSEETRKKMSEVRKGKYIGENNSFYGKHHTEEAKKKISEAHKGKQFTEEHKKKLSEARKGIHWYNNGKINVRVRECPPGFVPGILK